MTVGIARGGHDRAAAILVDAEETVRGTRGEERIERGLDAAVGAVFETNGHGEAAGHFPVRLRLRGARPDGGPTHDIGKILRDDRVEELGRGGKSERSDIAQDAAAEPQAFLQMAGLVHVRIIDQPLPPDGGSRLFEIDAHENAKHIGEFLAEAGETARVVERSLWVVDRTRTNDGQKAFVAPLQDGLCFGAPRGGGLGRFFAGRQSSLDLARRGEAAKAAHPHIFQRARLGGRFFADGHGGLMNPLLSPRIPRAATRLLRKGFAGAMRDG